MVESHPDKDELPAFKGSAVVYTGESIEEVRAIIHSDIYAKSGVWDLEKAQIIPVSMCPRVVTLGLTSRM